jgi:predicted membrane metal-binding protein
LFSPGFQLSFLTVLVIVLGPSSLYERLRAIGQWEPTETTPYPPHVPGRYGSISEVIFWNEREFRQKQVESHIRYRVEKAAIARALSTWRLSWLIRAAFGTILTTVAIQVALLPVMVLYFHRVSLVAPVSNVVEATLLGLLMISGCGFLAFNALSMILGDASSNLTNWFGELLIQFSHRVDMADGASFRTPDYGDYSLRVRPVLRIGLVWAFFCPLESPRPARWGTPDRVETNEASWL